MGLRKNIAAGSNVIPTLQRTRRYGQFSFAKENRPVEVMNLKAEHKALRTSMQTYGFLPAFPIMVSSVNGKFIVKDGQHRLTFAREFGLDVYFVIDKTDVSIADINKAQAGWSARDYAMSWANQGREEYRKALEFMDQWGLPIGSAFSILGGTIVFQNLKDKFHAGTFKIRTPKTALRVARFYSDLCGLRKGVRNANLLAALWACCHVDYFDESRIIDTVTRRPDMFYNAGTRENFLELLENIYNFKRRAREPLAFDAAEAMRARNPKTAGPNYNPKQMP